MLSTLSIISLDQGDLYPGLRGAAHPAVAPVTKAHACRTLTGRFGALLRRVARARSVASRRPETVVAETAN